MRIAQIAPIIESVPPEKYGGTERVVSTLTEELVRRGHKVTLFASGDSNTQAELSSVFPTSLSKANIENMYGPNVWSLLNVGVAYQRQEEFDIIHDHNTQNNPVSLPLGNLSKVPVVMTLHGPLYDQNSKPFEFFRKPYLVTISKRQAQPAPDLNYIGNVYHGMHMKHYPHYRDNDGYLLFVGRVNIDRGVEEKGLHHAIDIAEMVGMPLLIAARIDTSIKENVTYFNKVIKPRLNSRIQWLGEVDEKTRNKLMSRAYCLLHTVNFPEPFGLTLIEAMACACPIIAFDQGSIPELVQHGKTGFVVRSSIEAINCIPDVKRIDREYCRSYALENFSAEKMAEGYEEIYKKVLLQQKVTKSVPRTVIKTNGHGLKNGHKRPVATRGIQKVFVDL